MTMTAVGDETCPIPSNQVEESVTVMISFNNESGCQSGGSLLQHHDYWVDVIQLPRGQINIMVTEYINPNWREVNPSEHQQNQEMSDYIKVPVQKRDERIVLNVLLKHPSPADYITKEQVETEHRINNHENAISDAKKLLKEHGETL